MHPIDPEKRKPGERQDLTSRQLADALGVSESSVKRWVDDGVIRAHRTAGGHRRIPLSAAIEFIRRNRIVPVSPHVLSLPALPLVGGGDAAALDMLADALMRDDVEDVRTIIAGQYIAGLDLAAIGDGLLQPALERIGELWRSRGDGILIEHRAVISCMGVLSEMAMWLPPLEEGAPEALTAGGPGDPYILPPLLTSLVLRERGLLARNLGAMTPPETVMVAADRYRPKIVAISTSMEPEPRSFASWLAMAESLEKIGTRLIFGGRSVHAIPAEFRERAQVRKTLAELAAYTIGLLHGGPRAKHP